MQRDCSPDCAYLFLTSGKGVEHHKKVKQKLDRDRIRSKKLDLKTRSAWIKDLQREFNQFIRLRDADRDCISCGVSNTELAEKYRGGKWDAGHYRSIGSAPHLRFNEDNCFKQCKKCNQFKSGNAVEYRIRLIDRIGLDRVEAVESNQTPLKLTIEEIRELLAHYRKKCRELKKGIS